MLCDLGVCQNWRTTYGSQKNCANPCEHPNNSVRYDFLQRRNPTCFGYGIAIPLKGHRWRRVTGHGLQRNFRCIVRSGNSIRRSYGLYFARILPLLDLTFIQPSPANTTPRLISHILASQQTTYSSNRSMKLFAMNASTFIGSKHWPRQSSLSRPGDKNTMEVVLTGLSRTEHRANSQARRSRSLTGHRIGRFKLMPAVINF